MDGCRFLTLDKALNTKDTNGENPEVIIVMSNRGGGKTYDACTKMLRGYIDKGWEFAIICRYKSDLGNTVSGMFGAVLNDRFPDYVLYESVQESYSEVRMMWMDGTEKRDECCGYVLPLNTEDKLKKVSSRFYNVHWMFFDEFQAMQYCKDETNKFVNLHFTVARGGKEGVRFVPVVMLSNSLSILNPYFMELNITSKLQANTKMYRGDGFIVQRVVVEDVAEKQRKSPFNRAFSENSQLKANIDNDFMLDNMAGVCKPENWGTSEYIGTIVEGDDDYGYSLYSNGILYVTHKIDTTSQNVYAIHPSMNPGVQSILGSRLNKEIGKAWREGRLRYADLLCKNFSVAMTG